VIHVARVVHAAGRLATARIVLHVSMHLVGPLKEPGMLVSRRCLLDGTHIVVSVRVILRIVVRNFWHAACGVVRRDRPVIANR